MGSAAPQPWQILGVAADASGDEIKKAYARIVLEAGRRARSGDSLGLNQLDSARRAYQTLMAQLSPPVTTPPARADRLELPVGFASYLHQDNRFRGRGTLRINGEVLEIEARPASLIQWKRQTEQFALNQVCNVRRLGKRVSFSLPLDKGCWQAVLVCPDSDAARTLADKLPQQGQLSSDTMLGHGEDQFARLLQLTPHASMSWLLAALQTALFALLALAGGGAWVIEPTLLQQYGGNFPPLTTDGQWWRLLSAGFLHDSLPALLVSLYGLFIFGRLAERLHGATSFVLIYLLSSLCALTASLMFYPHAVTVGAGGANFAVLGLLLAFFVQERPFLPPTLRRPLALHAGVFVALSLGSGLLGQAPDAAAWGGGLLSGLMLGALIGVPARVQGARGKRRYGRFALACTCGLLASSAIAVVAPRPGSDFRVYQQLLLMGGELQRIEARLRDEGNQLIAWTQSAAPEAGSEAALDQSAWLETRGDELLQLERSLNALQPLYEGLQARRQILLKIIERQKEGLALLTEASRHNDQALFARSNEKFQQAEALGGELRQPLSWHP
jgi:rhomboid protease GluP